MTSRSALVHGVAPAASADWRAMTWFGYVFVGCTVGVFFLWAALARLDGAAVAQGVVSVESSRKTIQHLEGGIVREILVRDGDLVQQGAVLVRLDPTRIDSASDLYRTQLAAARAQDARLLAEREMRDGVEFPKDVIDQITLPAVAQAIEDQKQQFAVKRKNLLQSIDAADAQIRQAAKEAEQNNIDNETARAILENVSRELKSVQYLYDNNLVTLTRLTTLQREQVRLDGVISNTEAGKSRLQDKIRELSIRRDKITQDYKQEAAGQLNDLQKSISELKQQLIVASDSQQRVELRAPITGVVQQLRVFTIGGVVRPGDPILDLVPTSDDLIIRAKVQPIDADRVSSGMDAEVRFQSFRSFGLPIVRGKIVAVSRDRLVDDVTKEPYFDAQVNVGRNHLPESILEKLSAGMPAEVVIPTGERTVLNYLVTPVMERFGSSMRER